MKRIAVICDAWPPEVDRFLVGYPRDGRWHKPSMQIAGAYAARPETARGRAAEFGFRLHDSAMDAMREADGAMLFADAQVDRAIPVFRYGAVPRVLAESAKRVKFPLMGGCAMQAAFRLPQVDLPRGCEVEEALMAAVGDRAYEAAEAMQSMLERRKPGGAGVRSSRKVEGEAVWKEGFSSRLLAAALSRSDTPQGPTVKDGRTQDLVASGEVRRLAANPTAYVVEYADGLRATLLMLTGAVNDCNFAAQVRGRGVISTQFFMPPAPNQTATALLMAKVEDFLNSGIPPWPVERSLVAGAIVAVG